MSTNRWLGTSQPQPQIDGIVPGGNLGAGAGSCVGCLLGITYPGTVFTIAIPGGTPTKQVSYISVAADTVYTVAANLASACAASQLAEFLEVTWTATNGTIYATGPSDGTPFTVTASATGLGTLAITLLQSALGPNHWDDANNWSLAALPLTGDDVYIDSANAAAIKFGIDQHSVVLNSLNIYSTFTAGIGLAAWNTGSGSAVQLTAYYEYRQRFLKIQATTINIGLGTGSGCGQILIDTYTSNTTINVYSTGQAQTVGIPAVILQSSGSPTNTLNLVNGSVGAAFDPGSTAIFTTLRVGYQSSNAQASNQTTANLLLGPGATLTGATIDMNGGQVTAQSSFATGVVYGGVLTIIGDSINVTTSLTADDSGTVVYRSNGTITSGVASGGTFDCSQDLRPKTITNLTLYAGSSFVDSFTTVTFTNPFQVACRLSDLKELDLGNNFHLQRS